MTSFGLSLNFITTGSNLSQGNLSCPLTPNGPLWYLSPLRRLDNKGRITELDCPDSQLLPQDPYQTLIAPLVHAATPPGSTSWADDWLTKSNCIVRVHASSRRKLFSPPDSPIHLTQLTGQRITHMRLLPSGKTSAHVDNFTTAPEAEP